MVVPLRPTRVLVVCDWYLPGYRAGGPIRSIAAVVERLGDDFDFTVVCGDRDLGARRRYEGLQRGAFQNVGKARVRYVRSTLFGVVELWCLMARTPHDVLYINSLFSTRFGVLPAVLRWLRLVPRRSTVVAPRGQLSPGARRLGRVRKTLYLQIARAFGLYRGVRWQATSTEEKAEVEGLAPEDRGVVLAPNFVSPAGPYSERKRRRKSAGKLRVVYLSRVSENKNLVGALEVLRHARGQITFDIYGPRENVTYWRECDKLIKELPSNVKAQYRGVVNPQIIAATVGSYDLFYLPTWGESFGHAIFEALREGTPVLTSDRTPWRGLEVLRAGWDLPLEDGDGFRRVLERCVAMDDAEHAGWRSGALQAAACKIVDTEDAVAAMRSLFTPDEHLDSAGAGSGGLPARLRQILRSFG